jgi:hypothetical protein
MFEMVCQGRAGYFWSDGLEVPVSARLLPEKAELKLNSESSDCRGLDSVFVLACDEEFA